MEQYVDLIKRIIKEGSRKEDRTGVGTISIFGHQSTYNMDNGFPLLTMKNTYYRGIFHELLWFLNAVPEEYKKFGNTNIKYLVDHDVNIWNEWPFDNYKNLIEKKDEEAVYWFKKMKEPMNLEGFKASIEKSNAFAIKFGDLGPVYGKQWIDWGGGGPMGSESDKGINQIDKIVQQLKSNPNSRRIIVSAWNVAEIDDMLLPPCHAFFHFCAELLNEKERFQLFNEKMQEMRWGLRSLDEISEEEMEQFNIPRYKLHIQLYQRSADVFLGVPFNIASYALLLHMVAQVVNMKPGNFIHIMGDAHLYLNHEKQVNKFLNRTRKENGSRDFFNQPESFDDMIGELYGPMLPRLELNPLIKNISDFRMKDINILDYAPLKAIKAPVAV